MTPPKILYSFIEGQQRFVVVPELPPKPKMTDFADNEFGDQGFQKAMDHYRDHCYLLMESAPMIVNPEMVIEIDDEGNPWLTPDYVELKHGDQFPLPKGLELREEWQKAGSSNNNNPQWYTITEKQKESDKKIGFSTRKVFRIVRAEVKEIEKVFSKIPEGKYDSHYKGEVKPEPESQEDLLYAIRTMESMGAPDEVILKRFTIQRKKP